MGRRRHKKKLKNPQATTTLKEELPMVVNGPSGIKANKMVGHIQHILNVQAYYPNKIGWFEVLEG
jgi:hypothetical protein